MPEYQLVLQFAATTMTDFETLISFEESLLEHLRGVAEVDGHDFGRGEYNVFIYTDDPVKTFETSEVLRQSVLPDKSPLVAYRDVAGEEYTILWPPDQKHFSIA